MQNKKKTAPLARLAEQLRDPFRFRMFVMLVALAIAYLGVYSPLSGKIEEMQRKLSQEERREGLAQDVDMLRSQMDFLDGRLAEKWDANEWVHYVLNGVRALPLKLINLDSDEERKVGVYRAAALRLAVSGKMEDLDALLHWLETDQRLFRIEVIALEPHRDLEEHRVMQLTLLGLKG